MKKTFILFGFLCLIALVSAAIYQEPWIQNQLGDNHNLTEMGWISANTLNGTNIIGTFTGEVEGNMNWTFLQNYPSVCPGSSAITQLNDSVTCSDLWVDVAGDTMTGNLNVTGNVTAENVHLPAYIRYGSDSNITASADQWYNITFAKSASTTIKDFSHTHNDSTNTTVTVGSTGIYVMSYIFIVKDSAANPTAHVGARCVTNGTLIPGSYSERDTTKQNSLVWVHHSFVSSLTAGDGIQCQFRSADNTVALTSHGEYSAAPYSAQVSIHRVS